MESDVTSYFKLALHQLRCAPRLIIPFLISESLSYAAIWMNIFVLVLFLIPFLGKIAPIVEKNHELLSEILAGNSSDSTQIQGLEKDFSSLIPELLYVFIIFMLVFFIIMIIYFILSAWARAGTIGYIWKGTTSTINFRNFVDYAKQGVYRIAGLWFFIIIFSIALFLVPFITLLFIPQPLNVLVFILLTLLFFILWIIIMIVLFFSEECIIIEDRGVIDAIKRSKDIVGSNPGSVLIFIIMSAALWIIIVILSDIFDLLAGVFNSSFSTFFALLSLVILIPWLQLARLNFFLDITGRTQGAMEKEIEIVAIAKKFIKDSPGILIDFVRHNAVYILTALLFYGAGFGMGYYTGSSFSFLGGDIMKVLAEIWKEKLAGPYISMPVIDFLDYLSNNSLVGINTGLSGLFLGIPSILSVIITGIITGLFYGMFPSEIATGFLAVHGVFEVTGFVIITAAGIRLGAWFIRGLYNEYDIVEETLKVVLAALILIVIAAFLEAFITPIVFSSII